MPRAVGAHRQRLRPPGLDGGLSHRQRLILDVCKHDVHALISEAIRERATDIHVEPLENDLRIRYRIDGVLHDVMTLPHEDLVIVTQRLLERDAENGWTGEDIDLIKDVLKKD